MNGRVLYCFLVAALSISGSSCYGIRPSAGGGQTSFAAPRQVDANDVAVPEGYRIDIVATGLTFPTGVALDSNNVPHVIEAGYSYGEVWTTPRLLRVEPNGSTSIIASGDDNGPWNGVAYSDGSFYIAEGGEKRGGRILKVTADGSVTALLEGLPTMGDHHTNGPAIGADGSLYFALGTATNSGVVGRDNAKFGWLARRPDFHDIPCRDITLAGQNFETEDHRGKVSTGAFLPFGRASTPREIIRGRVPCSGAILRAPRSGGAPELVAWGFRNPFGLAFTSSGELYASENGYDDRGSRPVWGTADVLWKVESGVWYGWPDFSAGRSIASENFKPPGKTRPTSVLAEHPNTPPSPTAILGVHSSSNGFDFSKSNAFGHVGEAFVAQFGDQAPSTGKVLAPVGFKVVRVDVKSGVVQDFVTNRAKIGPASKIGGKGLERPVAARFDNEGTALFIVDFGVMLESKHGSIPQQGTGVLWRVTRGSQQ
jgi:glucose/arabinose dehydrogenase